jgi:hypothetical protein
MAKITDPDLLNQGTEVEFITGSLLIKLNRGQGALTSSNGQPNDIGVSLQTLYSFIKEEWKDDSNLIKFPFPMISITSEQFEFINGWNLSGSTEYSSSGTSTVAVDVSASHWMIKDGGWAVVNPNTGLNSEEWMNVTTLGSFDATTDQAYFVQIDPGVDANYATAVPTASVFPAEVNQGVQIYATESFDYRGYFNIFLREEGKSYANYDLLTEQNLGALTYRKYAMPLSNGNDLKVTSSDAGIDTDSDGIADAVPYNGMSITYYTQSQGKTIGGTEYQFDVIIEGNQGTAEQIYEFVQWSLRQQVDIDAGVDNGFTGIRGEVANDLLQFIGDTLRTETGVYIDNFQSADTNRLEFLDTGSNTRTFPFVAAGNLLFNDNLQNDASAIYKVFFTNDDAGVNSGSDFGTKDAIIIQQNGGGLITGSVATSASRAFDYDYDNNVQRGNGSAATDVPFTAVALGLGTAQYVVTTGTITRSTTNTISFVAALERNYLNP